MRGKAAGGCTFPVQHRGDIDGLSAAGPRASRRITS